MREIKFRAWDKRINRMLYPETSNKFIGAEMEFYPTVFKVHEITHPEDLILMQFTGLKDKNGKDIYEGDIVRISGYGIMNLITDIYWEDCLGGFYSRNLYESDTFEHSIFCIEIIGNIYENPELLEETK